MSYELSAANRAVLGKLADAITSATPIEVQNLDPQSFVAKIPQENNKPPLWVFDTIPALEPVFWKTSDLGMFEPRWGGAFAGINDYRGNRRAKLSGHVDPAMKTVAMWSDMMKYPPTPLSGAPTSADAIPVQGYRVPFAMINYTISRSLQVGLSDVSDGDYFAVILEGVVAFGMVAGTALSRRLFSAGDTHSTYKGPSGRKLPLDRYFERPAADFSVNLMCRLRPGRFRSYVEKREGPPPRALVIVFPRSRHSSASGSFINLTETQLLAEIRKTALLYRNATGGVATADHDHTPLRQDNWLLPPWVPMTHEDLGINNKWSAEALYGANFRGNWFPAMDGLEKK